MKKRFISMILMFTVVWSTFSTMIPNPASAGSESVTVDLDMTLAMGDIADGLGKAAVGDPNVSCDPETAANPECARLALRLAQAAANSAFLSGAALKGLKFSVQVGSGVAGLLGGGEAPASLGEAALKEIMDKIKDAIKDWILKNPLLADKKTTATVQPCGTVNLEWKLLGPATADGPLRLELLVSGNCGCKEVQKGTGQGRLGKWSVTAIGDIKPELPLSAWRSKIRSLVAKVLGIDLPWTPRLEHIEYTVNAHCSDCDHYTTPHGDGGDTHMPGTTEPATAIIPESEPTPYVPVVDRICAQRCNAEYVEWLKWRTALGRAEADAANPKLMSDPTAAAAVRSRLKINQEREAEARRAYYECAKRCYDQAVRAGEIPAVPGEIEELKPTPTPAPTSEPTPLETPKPAYRPLRTMDQDPNLVPVQPKPGESGSASGVSLPPWSSENGTLVINVNPDDRPEGGANGVVLIAEDDQGNKHLLQGHGAAGKLIVDTALTVGVLRTITLVTGFDPQGNPIPGSSCEIGTPTHIVDTQPVARIPLPSDGPAISEAGSTAQPGDAMTLHVTGNDPLTTRFELDGQPVKELSVSDNSAVIQFDKATSLAHHQLVMYSDDQASAPLSIFFVQLTPVAMVVSHPGVVQTVTILVAGLGPEDRATMWFQLVGDAASIVDGGTSASVPVADGKAQIQIVGRHAGQINLRYRLVVQNPQFADGQ
jgi:hypothetical protein